MNAEELYEKGNCLRRQGKFSEALNAYTEAARIDPEGPASTAKQMLEEQFAFYCKDYYNP